ncbi:hypothetical protein LTR27_009892 [Elasticomyces elasticus]|nr:hypothetical protein LTR27_009892 [Elasticomyces elasticus]
MELPRKADADPSPGWHLVESKKSRNTRLREALPATSNSMTLPTLDHDYTGLLRGPTTRKKNKKARLRASKAAVDKTVSTPALRPDHTGLPRTPTAPSLTDYSFRIASHIPSVYNLQALRHFTTYVATIKEIGHANLQSFAKYLHPLSLLRLSREGTELPEDVPGTGEYAIVRRSFGLVARVRMTADTLDAEGVPVPTIVSLNGAAITVRDWLAGLTEPDVELPTECDIEPIRNRPWDRPQMGHLTTQHRRSGTPVADIAPPGTPSRAGWYNLVDCGLLRLDRSTRAQVKAIVRHHLSKRFPHHCGFGMVTRLRGFPNIDFLNRMTLNMSDHSFMHFFGADLPCLSHVVDVKDPPGAAIAKMTGLRHLELRFQSRMWSHTSNPWPNDRLQYVFNGGRGCNPNLENMASVDPRGFPCRKAMIDYLLSFTYQYIKAIPDITLTGYIKHSTGDRWMGIFATNIFRRRMLEERLAEHIVQIKALQPAEL